MTPKQKQVLDFIAAYRAEHGYSPAIIDIARHLGSASRGSVHGIVDRLVEGGYLQRTSEPCRNLVPVRTEQDWAALGDVAQRALFMDTVRRLIDGADASAEDGEGVIKVPAETFGQLELMMAEIDDTGARETAA